MYSQRPNLYRFNLDEKGCIINFMTIDYDLCFAWNWPYDCDFAEMLAIACQRNKVSFLQVTPENLQYVLNALSNHELSIPSFL